MSTFNAKATSAYRNVNLQTRAATHDQYELVNLMFDTVLECLAKARGAIEQNAMPEKVEQISKAIRIVHEGLRTSLDMENGGELAANLANLYEYCVLRMTQANASNDAQALAEVADLLRPVADAWKQMRERPPGNVAETAASEPRATVAPTPPNKTAFNAASMYGSRLGGSLLVGA
jgi:flagellar secretion chaperone FliS